MRQGNICALIDDDINEAQGIATMLRRKGFPFEVRPIVPSRGIQDASRVIERTHPRVAMVDVTLATRPLVDSSRLALNLVRKGIQTVFVTKDRDIVDQGNRPVNGMKLPVYFKRSLYQDDSCMERCVRQLGGTALTPDEDYRDRLAELQDQQLLRKLTNRENRELKQLERRLVAEEHEEAHRGRTVRAENEARFKTLIKTIRKIAVDLEEENKRH